MDPSGGVIVTVGLDEYPMPVRVTAIAVTFPLPSTVAVAAAGTPAGAATVTSGG